MKISFLFLFLFLLVIISLMVGESSFSLLDLLTWNLDDTSQTILLDIRLPRILGAIIIGGTLSVAGCSYQAIFQNPLVSPDLLGASIGAVIGTLVGTLFGCGLWITFLLSIVTSLLVLFVCVYLGMSIGRIVAFKGLILILVGILITSLLASLLNMFQYIYTDNNTFRSISYFLQGTLNGLTLSQVGILFVICLPFIFISLLFSLRLDLFALPLEIIRTQGINLNKLIFCILFIATVLSSSSIVFVGIISWISLVVPNIVRFFNIHSNKELQRYSFIVGAIFLLCCDTISRMVITIEIPLSIITGCIGAPIFVLVLAKQTKKVIYG